MQRLASRSPRGAGALKEHPLGPLDLKTRKNHRPLTLSYLTANSLDGQIRQIGGFDGRVWLESRGWDPIILPLRGGLTYGFRPVARASVAARLNLSGYTAATPATPSNGRLILCTVPGSTANCLAMTRTPTGIWAPADGDAFNPVYIEQLPKGRLGMRPKSAALCRGFGGRSSIL